MSNMSYCRCENTYNDLLEVYNDVDPDELSDSEKEYFEKLLKLCKKMDKVFGEDED